MPISTYRHPVDTPEGFPGQHQTVQPGRESIMTPAPVYDDPHYRPAGKLQSLVALVTGGDSGIGRAISLAFAKEGASVAVVHFGEGADAAQTQEAIQSLGKRCEVFSCDLRHEEQSLRAVNDVLSAFGRIDILVNNAAVQFPQNNVADITPRQLANTFATNVWGYFHTIRAVMPHLTPGASIINTTSVTAYKGSERLVDYAASKGAIVSLTRSLALSLAPQGIRVNAVAPGPVWTPLIPSSFSPQEVEAFGKDVPLGRAAQPFELAPAYVFLASDDSAYMTGQVLHVNGGVMTDS